MIDMQVSIICLEIVNFNLLIGMCEGFGSASETDTYVFHVFVENLYNLESIWHSHGI